MNNQNSKDNNKKKSNGNHNDENDEINFHGDRTERNNVQGKDKSNNKKRPYPFNCMDVPIPGKVRKGRRHGGQSNIETVGKSATPSGSIQHDAPRGINVYQFAEARAYEIKNLQQALKHATQNSLPQQRLPRHMRRRAASHDIRRIPKRIRPFAKKEIERRRDQRQDAKKPARKFRRKPKNLLEEYSRRARKHNWLETHIWHAKRFKMIEKWGYKIADQPCDKSFRACYRATNKACLIQDKSYMEVIEIMGEQQEIVNALNRLVLREGQDFDADSVKSGKQYGEAVLHHIDKAPLNPIAPVKYLWVVNDACDYKFIIIFHPVVSKELLGVLKELFQLKEENVNSADTGRCVEFPSVAPTAVISQRTVTMTVIKQESGKVTKQDESRPVKIERDLDDDRIPGKSKMSNDTDISVENEELKGKQEAELKQKEVEMEVDRSSNSEVLSKLQPAKFKRDNIILTHYKLDFVFFSLTGKLSHAVLNNILKIRKSQPEEKAASKKEYGCIDFGDVMDRAIINVNVEDPRINKPTKKKNILENANKVDSARDKNDLYHGELISELWDPLARRKAKENKLPDHKIHQMRSELLLPSSQLNIESTIIPAVVLQKPPLLSSSESTFGGGFEVLLPIGWAMPFWIAFIYEGCRAGGLREDFSISMEALVPYFPNDFPDSRAGKVHNMEIKMQKEAKDKRCARAQKQNYQILGIENPFYLPWDDVIKEWKRNLPELLSDCKPLLTDADSFKQTSMYVHTPVLTTFVLRSYIVLEKLKDFINGKEATNDKNNFFAMLLEHSNALVPVRVYSSKKGCPEENSPLYTPLNADIESYEKDKEEEYPEDKYFGPVEDKHKGYINKYPYICTENEILRHNALTIGVNQRWLIGYIQSGRYTFTKGKGAGHGLVSMSALVYHLKTVRNKNMLLFRNISSLQYRFCRFDILV